MKALIIVDLQQDFLPGGALAVAKGDEVVPFVNQLLEKKFDLVVASMDWHPKEHGSFATNHSGKNVGESVVLDGLQQILWPVHCVQNSKGAEFAPSLKTDKIDYIIYKGTDPAVDSYSAFYDNEHRKKTGLGALLKEKGITEVYVVGLATDYCVKYTVLDSCHEGFRTYVLAEGCRGVELQKGDCTRAFNEMKEAGAIIYADS